MLHAVEQTCVTRPFYHVLVTLVCVGIVVPLVVLYQTQNPSPLRHSPRLRRSVVLCFSAYKMGHVGTQMYVTAVSRHLFVTLVCLLASWFPYS